MSSHEHGRFLELTTLVFSYLDSSNAVQCGAREMDMSSGEPHANPDFGFFLLPSFVLWKTAVDFWQERLKHSEVVSVCGWFDFPFSSSLLDIHQGFRQESRRFTTIGFVHRLASHQQPSP